jgi:hypothetical protein
LNNKCNATIKFDVSKGKVIYCWEDAGSYCCWHGIGWQCAADVVMTWQCATDVAVCGWHGDAVDVAIWCWHGRRGRLLLTWPFAADVAVCCWRGRLLLTWLREGFFFFSELGYKTKGLFFFFQIRVVNRKINFFFQSLIMILHSF